MCGVAIVSTIGFAWLQRDARFGRRLAGQPLTVGRRRSPLVDRNPGAAAS